MFNTSSYAMQSKIRARYGRMLGERDYTALTECRSLSDFVAFLKGKPDYGKALAELSDTQISRGQLEFLLRENQFRDNIELCFSLESIGHSLADFFIGLEESGFLLNVLRVLKSGDNPFLNTPTRAFYRYTHIDFDALADAHDYKSFLEAVKKTRFYEVLRPFEHLSDGAVDITTAEVAIYRKLYGDFFGAERSSEEVSELISAAVEISNISILLRAKKFYGDTEDPSRIILPYWHKIDKNTADALVSASYKDFLGILSGTVYGKLLSDAEAEYDFQINARRMLHSRYVHALHFSQDPAALVFAFIQLRRIELQNLIIIIEGIRYNVNMQSVRRLLVCNFADDIAT